VTRIVEIEYGSGVYDPTTQSSYGVVRFRSLDGEATAWGVHKAGQGCGPRWTLPGDEWASTNWVLPLGDYNRATGCFEGVIGGDPAARWSQFGVVVPGSLSTESPEDLATAFSGGPGPADDRGPDRDGDGESLGGLILAIALLVGMGAAVRWSGGSSVRVCPGYVFWRRFEH
jgi:hypothetical protein